ncbi:MAG: protein-ADP-ribose hydrolase [Lachnospiraceae bacterium]|nr:protein-ADP-ribose hydrolase [Lachnospiraceae bacterium]
MNQSERRHYLINTLLDENVSYRGMDIPGDEDGQKRLLRSLMNVRIAKPISDEFIKLQDEYLKEELGKKHVTTLDEMEELQPGIYVWQGDITTLKVGAIVNAANSGMTGCYQPCHACIDNCIHTYAGIQLRLKCDDIMKKQGHEEPTGQAKITPAYNLLCDYVLHTVGPIIYDKVRKEDEELLASCYENCMRLADENGVESIAFCCISTGVFRFPNDRAAQIAVDTVKNCMKKYKGINHVVFNVFKDDDLNIYLKLLS